MSYGLDPAQFNEYVVQPACVKLGVYSVASVQLVLGTAMHESELRWLDQIDDRGVPGPAYGLFQMEAATHSDIWNNYLEYRYHLKKPLQQVLGHSARIEDLRTNLIYAAMMCRICYLRKPGMPEAYNARNLAEYWKNHYNTSLGKGTVEKAIPHFQRAVEIVR